MSANVEQIFERGGRDLVNLLEYCVLSVKKDVLFLYLAGQYRLRPGAVSVVALYDLFCANDAPARISVNASLPPFDRRLEQAIVPFRHAVQWIGDAARRAGKEVESEGPLPPLLPPRYLFDSILQSLTVVDSSQIQDIHANYDPALTPHENLPGGKLTVGGRAFVDNVWLPVVRPRLVSAGFWGVAAVA